MSTGQPLLWAPIRRSDITWNFEKVRSPHFRTLSYTFTHFRTLLHALVERGARFPPQRRSGRLFVEALRFFGRFPFSADPVGLDTDTVELTVKPLLSQLITLERIQLSRQFFTGAYVRVDPYDSASHCRD